jgi:HAD superfamily hydrolase (TIGR01509 family)
MEAEGVAIPLSQWLQNIGLPREAFNPLDFLEKRLGRPIDREALERRKREAFKLRMKDEPLRPGVQKYLEEGKRRKLRLALCSSSPRQWVVSNLSDYGISDVFDAMVTGSDVTHIKPHPELYLKAVETLGLPAESCIAFEDSPKGVQSAKAAGLFCVAVSNPITRHADLTEGDILLSSLAEMLLEELERRFLETGER